MKNYYLTFNIINNTIKEINILTKDIQGIVEPIHYDDEVVFMLREGPKGTFKGSIRDLLRTWLQAAVDNSKYNYMYQWNYTEPHAVYITDMAIPVELTGRDKLWMSLFRYKNGKPLDINAEFGTNDIAIYFKYIKPLISKFSGAADIRRGSDYIRGRYGLSDTIEKSRMYDEYASNKIEFLQDLGQIVTKDESKGFTVDYLLKSTRLTPAEIIAVTPSRVYDEMTSKFKYLGFNNTPFRLHEHIHMHAHNNATKKIDSEKSVLYNKAYNKDKASNVVVGSKAEWLKQQIKDGFGYNDKMSKEFLQLLRDIKNLGPQSMDRNDRLVKWKFKYDKEFRSLSNVAKLSATISFLQGHKTLSETLSKEENANWRRVFPPVSAKKHEKSVLDAGTIRLFFKYYNENVTDPTLVKDYDRAGSAIEIPSYRGTKRVIRETCG